MYSPKILYKWSFDCADIFVEKADNTFKLDSIIDSKVMDLRNVIQDTSSSQWVHLWDGLRYRVEELSCLQDKIKISISSVNYRYMATYRSVINQLEGYSEWYTNHLAVATLMKTMDNKYVFWKRTNTGKSWFIWGWVQQDELEINVGSDFELTLRKEIHEETGVLSTEIKGIEGIWIVFSETSNHLLIFETKLLVTSEELYEIFEKRLKDEMSELIFVEEIDIYEYLKNFWNYWPWVSDLL